MTDARIIQYPPGAHEAIVKSYAWGHEAGARETAEEMNALERRYAAAIMRIADLEAALTAAQARNTELVEENRRSKPHRGAPFCRECGLILEHPESLQAGVCRLCRGTTP